MSSLAMSSSVDQQIVLHQFTAKHSVQARAMLGWSREELARQAGVPVSALQQFESLGEVDDDTRLALAFRLEAEGLVFFPGFAPGWGMRTRRFGTSPTEPAAQSVISRLMGSTTAALDGSAPQPNGA
ncbi:helix-turn-helix transcriptional regulator [Pseudomonas lurida]|jgi:DNA-binding XRE family transcriptional regulator|uniref:Helix-turn-helix transcriptional regulator n=1 Tax=Pseudomonas quebecensis TaxID=2995174 RepID=A0ABY6QK79_9PSED|nr:MULTISPECIES: helix-turn-helix transcriptional regulator [Pseudomonas]MBA1294906.1 helix-turn-helix transcriptional regulator [Pseudomonas lurida]MCP1512431.1 DNA-binding XRE family transcriptional regulator [Pseudomonas rhodesiae]MCX4064420.1 helix-turn-helix transcriptional regulator [Pseudomonas quebecensis]MDF9771273.1 DNA-binding XRE family transcriptional regulator [Pseudomonas rhodesiae]UZW19719.1 helix-turn-helix transcriptional regulator [Pseudomonas quebecensis]